MDISIIFNCHREGELVYKSLLSLQQMRSFAEKHGLNIECVVVIDNGDTKTKQIIADSKFIHPNDQVHEVDYKDVGLARNHGVSVAKAEYIATFDADDYFSENWLFSAYQLIQKLSDDFVLHPEYVVAFGYRNYFFKMCDQEDPTFSAVNLFKHNAWVSCVFCSKKLLLAVPYQEARVNSGFGYEDWHFNCEIIARGYQHKVVPRTVLFYRRKPKGSRLLGHFHDNTIIRPSLFFNQLEAFV